MPVIALTNDTLMITRPRKPGRPRRVALKPCPVCGRMIRQKSKTCRLHRAIFSPRLPGDVVLKVFSLLQVGVKLKGADLSRQLGVSKERIRQIRNRYQLCDFIVSREDQKHICPVCNLPLPRGDYRKYHKSCRYSLSHTTAPCSTCGTEVPVYRSDVRLKKSKRGKLFCSRPCFVKYQQSINFGKPPAKMISLVCANCGVAFQRYKSKQVNKHYYHNRDCLLAFRSKSTLRRPRIIRRPRREKGFCAHGHPLTSENTVYWGEKHHRQCRICQKERGARRKLAGAWGKFKRQWWSAGLPHVGAHWSKCSICGRRTWLSGKCRSCRKQEEKREVKLSPS